MYYGKLENRDKAKKYSTAKLKSGMHVRNFKIICGVEFLQLGNFQFLQLKKTLPQRIRILPVSSSVCNTNIFIIKIGSPT